MSKCKDDFYRKKGKHLLSRYHVITRLLVYLYETEFEMRNPWITNPFDLTYSNQSKLQPNNFSLKGITGKENIADSLSRHTMGKRNEEFCLKLNSA